MWKKNLIVDYSFYLQGLPGVDGREGIPGMPGAKVELLYLVLYLRYFSVTDYDVKDIFAIRSSASLFSLSYFLQGSIGKAGTPGEVGLQGLPVSLTFHPKCQGGL